MHATSGIWCAPQLRLRCAAVACGAQRGWLRVAMYRGVAAAQRTLYSKLAKNQDEYLLCCDMASKLTLSLVAQLVLDRQDH